MPPRTRRVVIGTGRGPAGAGRRAGRGTPARTGARTDARRDRDPRRDDQGAQARARQRRPVTEARSGAHPDERDPQLLGPTLDRVVAERGWETDAAVGAAMGRWAAIVGPEVAAHSTPVSWTDGELVVQADSTAWATQIRLLAPALLARLAAELGAGTVTSVTVRGPSAPSWKRGPWSVRGRGPRDTYG